MCCASDSRSCPASLACVRRAVDVSTQPCSTTITQPMGSIRGRILMINRALTCGYATSCDVGHTTFRCPSYPVLHPTPLPKSDPPCVPPCPYLRAGLGTTYTLARFRGLDICISAGQKGSERLSRGRSLSACLSVRPCQARPAGPRLRTLGLKTSACGCCGGATVGGRKGRGVEAFRSEGKARGGGAPLTRDFPDRLVLAAKIAPRFQGRSGVPATAPEVPASPGRARAEATAER